MSESLTGAPLSQRLAIGVPVFLLGGAYIGQFGFDLYPCEMCWWQRYPHFAALAFGALSFVAAPRRLWIALAGIAILVSGLIGGFHAGVEYGWWQGFTDCSTMLDPNADPMDAVMNAPLVRCDVAPWDLFGISLAGWNFLFSTIGGLAILTLLMRSKTH